MVQDSGGDCTAVTQARHAQAAGASAVVLAHGKCICMDKECTEHFKKETSCDAETPFLINDGSGADIHIPAFMLFKLQAQNIQEQAKQKNQPILLELTWGLPITQQTTPDNDDDDKEAAKNKPAVNVHLWASPRDAFLDEHAFQHLQTVMSAFTTQQAMFSPRFPLTDGTLFQCDQTAEVDGPCDHLCSNHGRYCLTHDKDLSGFVIVKETLRRMCIWKHYGEPLEKDAHKPEMYWQYIIYHRQHCNEPHHFASDECIQKAYQHAKIDQAVIEDQCMKDSGDVDADSTNSLLQEMMAKQSRSGIVGLPAITVNHKVLDEPASAFALFRTVCEHYWFGESRNPAIGTPEICDICSSCPNVVGCIQEGHCVAKSKEQKKQDAEDDKNKNKKKKRHGWRWFFFLSFCVMVAGAWYYVKM
jgi:hypothetical protein